MVLLLFVILFKVNLVISRKESLIIISYHCWSIKGSAPASVRKTIEQYFALNRSIMTRSVEHKFYWDLILSFEFLNVIWYEVSLRWFSSYLCYKLVIDIYVTWPAYLLDSLMLLHEILCHEPARGPISKGGTELDKTLIFSLLTSTMGSYQDNNDIEHARSNNRNKEIYYLHKGKLSYILEWRGSIKKTT